MRFEDVAMWAPPYGSGQFPTFEGVVTRTGTLGPRGLPMVSYTQVSQKYAGGSKRWELKDQPAASSKSPSPTGGPFPGRFPPSQSSSPSPSLSPSPKRPLLGFRSWRIAGAQEGEIDTLLNVDLGTNVDPHRPYLCSATRPQPWVAGPQRAECPLTGEIPFGGRLYHSYDGAHSAPGENCMCGYWMLPEVAPAIERGEAVVGAVMAWGKCVEHEYGMRCEHMQIIGLLRDPQSKVMIITVANLGGPGENNTYKAVSGRANGSLVDKLGRLYDVPVLDTPAALTAYVDRFEP